MEYFEYGLEVISAFSINWPYIAFSGLDMSLVIFNMYNKELVQRIQLAPEGVNINICQTFISDTKDLFALVYKDKMFHMYQIDLDKWNIKEFDGTDEEFKNLYQLDDPILRFSNKSGKSLTQMYVRGSSNKEYYDFNEKLVVLFLFEDELWMYIKLNELKGTATEIQFIQKISSKNFYMLNNHQLFFMKDVYTGGEGGIKQTLSCQKIQRLDIGFCTVSVHDVIRDSTTHEIIKSFNVDQRRNKLIIILKRTAEMPENKTYRFKIYCLEKNEELYMADLEYKPLIGRLLSGLYTFVDGHIYYNNNVIKIRYDLILGQNSHLLVENEVFDYYFDIFILSKGLVVRSNTPLDSH